MPEPGAATNTPWSALVLYATAPVPVDAAAYDAARACLLDALASGLRSLADPDCVRLLGPIVPGATLIGGARVIGTSFELDPVHAAFNLGALFRWCAEPRPGRPRECHPADVLGAILAAADWRSRRAAALGEAPLVVRDVLLATIRAHEIHATLADAHGQHARGRDDVLHVRVASAAVVTALLGGTRAQVHAAVSHAVLDGGPLRAAPQAGGAARDRWAIGDAASRGVRHALLALAGEPACAMPAGDAAADVLAAGRSSDPPLGAGRMLATLASAPSFGEHEVGRRFLDAAAARFAPRQAAAIAALCTDSAKLDALAVHDFVSALVRN